jgi:hypothetical protein
MDTSKTTKPGMAGANPGAAQAYARKLAREQLAPEMDRYLLRLGLTGLLDGGAAK